MEALDAYVFSFVSQKGGVSKSTLARGVAVEFSRNNYKVKVADLDVQQGTFINWYRRRLKYGVEPLIESVETYSKVKKAIAAAKGYELLIVDCPARSSKGTTEIAKYSDLIIQPTGTSLDDLDPAILLFHELRDEGVDTSKMFMALCKVGTEAESETARDYIQRAGYQCLDGVILERPAYRQAQNMGQTILETKFSGLNTKAAEVLKSLVDKLGKMTEKKIA